MERRRVANPSEHDRDSDRSAQVMNSRALRAAALKRHWMSIALCVVMVVMLVAMTVRISALQSSLRVDVTGTYGGNYPGTPSLVFDPTGHYALCQNGAILQEGSYRVDERTITMDSGGALSYALYIDGTVYQIRDRDFPAPYPRTSYSAIYPCPPST